MEFKDMRNLKSANGLSYVDQERKDNCRWCPTCTLNDCVPTCYGCPKSRAQRCPIDATLDLTKM